MAISNQEEFFAYELSAAYSAEQTLQKGTMEMRDRAQDSHLRQLLDEHVNDSQKQIKELERAFKEMGRQPRYVRCHFAEGLIEDFRATASQVNDVRMIDLAILGGWSKAEHVEIAVYRGLCEKAELMGNERVYDILKSILAAEERTAKTIERTSENMGKRVIGKSGGGRDLSFRQ